MKAYGNSQELAVSIGVALPGAFAIFFLTGAVGDSSASSSSATCRGRRLYIVVCLYWLMLCLFTCRGHRRRRHRPSFDRRLLAFAACSRPGVVRGSRPKMGGREEVEGGCPCRCCYRRRALAARATSAPLPETDLEAVDARAPAKLPAPTPELMSWSLAEREKGGVTWPIALPLFSPRGLPRAEFLP